MEDIKKVVILNELEFKIILHDYDGKLTDKHYKCTDKNIPIKI